MTTNTVHSADLGSRRFDATDQAGFAALSGDVNPMHMDALAARRTQAGQRVVHGVHAVLVALERLAVAGCDLARLIRLDAAFGRFIPLDECVTFHWHEKSAAKGVVEIRAGELVLTTVKVRFGDVAMSAVRSLEADRLEAPKAPLERALEDMAGCAGWLDAPEESGREVSSRFPVLATTLSARVLESLALMSTVVGMHAPGLHSIFSSFSVSFGNVTVERSGLGFEVNAIDPRFRMVALSVASAHFSGKIEAFVRQAPTSLSSRSGRLAAIPTGRYTSINALVIGGSRGLGEATARAIAAGGGCVTVTYRAGEADAARVASEINGVSRASRCRTLRYDAFEPPEEQLDTKARDFTHLFYFATTQIFRQKSGAFDAALHREFVDLYVSGFQQLCLSMVGQIPDGKMLRVFYPSSIAVAERPRGMTEYAMAKAAGEILCTDMNAMYDTLDVLVDRLPRVRTDQTATVSPVASADPLDLMLPLIDRMLDDRPVDHMADDTADDSANDVTDASTDASTDAQALRDTA